MGEDAIEPAIPWLQRFGKIDAHHRFFTSLLVAAITFLCVPWHLPWPVRALATWNAYNLTGLGLMWFSIVSTDPSAVARDACLQDSSRTAIFFFVLIAAIASIFAVGAELGTAKGLDRAHLGAHVVFCLLTVAGSWALVHTIFTLRYAHVFYGLGEDEKPIGGLEFPDEERPDYLDFAYYSFTIGMTSQTSDVQVNSQRIRRLTLAHGIISFVFNLAILSLSLNIISSLFFVTLIDTHAHLDYEDFAADFDAVLQRAREAGIARIITIGTSVESSRRAVELAVRHPMIYAVVGVHPTTADEAPAEMVAALRELVAHPRVVAIGETGLDYHHLPEGDGPTHTYKTTQATVFRQQLDLAAETNLNVVIHQRDSWEDTLAILRDYTGKLRGVFHCFGGTPAQADEVLALGHLVSFTGIATFKNAVVVRETAAHVPADRFMVETDCPYLAPVPYRGKRCEPAHTRETAVAVAQTRGETLDALAARTTANAEAFFRFSR